MNATLALLLAALIAAPLTAAFGTARPSLTRPVAIVTTAIAFLAALYNAARPGPAIDKEWAPAWGMRLHFEADGLAVLFALLATGIGLLVVVYASGYIPLHLHHEHRPDADQTRFFAFILLFMGAMTGLVMAQDLMLIFLFWDLTAIASYYLIGFDTQKREARISAFTALIVTGISAVGFLIGALMLDAEFGSFQLPVLIRDIVPNDESDIALVLILIAALAKSAQVPLHFWLPRAMAAPTPVSAYLHSAAMVAAGVFLIGRFYPLIALREWMLDLLIVVGVASMLTGGILALTRDNMKQLLAYSTIAQYGYIVTMFGLGGKAGVFGAMFAIIAHGLGKSALFLTAGTVTEATGARELSQTGGLRRTMPLLAVASGISAASLAAIPLTMGFFKDEYFFEAAAHHGRAMQIIAVVAASMTFCYLARFWWGIFCGPEIGAPRPVSFTLVAPIAALGALSLIGGIWPEPFARVASRAGQVALQSDDALHPAYHLHWTIENGMAIAAIGIGLVLFLTRRIWFDTVEVAELFGARFGPERVYRAGVLNLNNLSDRIHWIEVRDLRSRVATVLAPAALMVVITLIFTNADNSFRMGNVHRDDWPLIMMVAVASIAGVAAAFPRDHFSMALALSGVGFAISVVFALLRAPDVALVAVLVETLFGLLFFAFLALLPRNVEHADVVPSDEPQEAAHTHRVRDSVLAAFGGLLAFLVAWGVLSRPAPVDSILEEYVDLTPEAHGDAIVTVILADFRGLDTMGEITVIGIAFLGIATFIRRRRLR
ncbi:MAG: hydrogen gas-evolving membrane-bound hydrogenase subunit E [Thermomicrobiales bacterium]